MRAIVTAGLLAAALIGSVGAFAEPVATQPGAFPRDEVSLRDLDNKQLRIVRRAGAQCFHSGEGGFASRGPASRACIIGLADNTVATSEDEALQAYHNALPLNVRYDENRPGLYWQRFVEK